MERLRNITLMIKTEHRQTYKQNLSLLTWKLIPLNNIAFFKLLFLNVLSLSSLMLLLKSAFKVFQYKI